ncbi:MAG TPA: ACT domain-containing protein [Candidatus Omnitrophota bacterium]|nr:ACT domain-containing protein [Candidatus Omnitrophota bacterium]
MKITQLSVFLQNQKGCLYDVIKILGEAGIDIKTLTLAESREFGVLRLIVDKPEEALKRLRAEEHVASLTEIVAVEVEDRPGGLAKVLKVFSDHGINIEYMYAVVEKNANKAIMVFRFDDMDKAIAALSENNIRVIRGKDIIHL